PFHGDFQRGQRDVPTGSQEYAGDSDGVNDKYDQQTHPRSTPHRAVDQQAEREDRPKEIPFRQVDLIVPVNGVGELGTYTSAVPYTSLPMLVAGIANVVLVSAPRSD